jgi:predicted nucleic acid-binding protein
MKVYLDNCCFNRPFDDQSNIMNRMEADAKLFIQEQIKNGSIDLVWSSVNEFENNDNPSFEKRERIGLRSKDALHVACAIYVKADFFITTDKKILNKDVAGISLANPITFVEEFFYDKCGPVRKKCIFS